jgi:pimeloyl-ACP methyl ester carboxylesterase
MPAVTTRVVPANGIEICCETFGDPGDPALLLVMGFSAQMIVWPDEFCRGLAERGFHVIRFDNRDCGLSTHLDGVPADIEGAMMAQLGEGPPPSAPYTLSMGGMIVQAMAIEHPERVLSMTSIMSTTGEREYFESSPEAMAGLLAPPPTDRYSYMRQVAANAKVFGSRRYYDEAASLEQAGRSFDRSFYPEGSGRQMVAIAASGDRANGLRSLTVPTLVIHGRDDTLIMPSGGFRTAELVPGAALLLVNDMGHDMPEPLWPLLADAITSHAHRSQR